MEGEVIDLSSAPLSEEERAIVDHLAMRQYMDLLPSLSDLPDYGFPPMVVDSEEGDDEDDEEEEPKGNPFYDQADGDEWKPKKPRHFYPFVALAETSMHAALSFVYVRRGYLSGVINRLPRVLYERTQPPPCEGGVPPEKGGEAPAGA